MEVDLKRGRPVSRPDPGNYLRTHLLVRLSGTPVGSLWLDTSDASDVRSLGKAIHAQLAPTLTRTLLGQALADGAYASGFVTGQFDCSPESAPADMSPITVAICTRDRASDLGRCLSALDDLRPRPDVVVIDNAPATDATRDLVQRSHPWIRYVLEPCPGLNWARRRAVREARGDVLAFIDDDVVVDASWVREVVGVFARHPDVMAMTGLVLAADIETPAQEQFERLGGLNKGYVRRWYRRAEGAPAARLFANTGPMGVGANMAFRRRVFDQIGSFDPALGAGTTTGGGDDLDIFFRVIKAGHTLVYWPAAIVRHRHRRDDAALESQMRNWSAGMQAYLRRTARTYPDERLALMGLSARLLGVYYPRRVVQSLFDRRLSLSLAVAELQGAWRGLTQFGAARRRACELADRFGEVLDDDRHSTSSDSSLGRSRDLSVDLRQPLPDPLPGPDDADLVRVHVTSPSGLTSLVSIVTGGAPLSRLRLSDAIVAQVPAADLDPTGLVDAAIRTALLV